MITFRELLLERCKKKKNGDYDVTTPTGTKVTQTSSLENCKQISKTLGAKKHKKKLRNKKQK